MRRIIKNSLQLNQYFSKEYNLVYKNFILYILLIAFIKLKFNKNNIKGNKPSIQINEYALNALSPLDGRYEKNISGLKEYFSEKALIKYRIKVEIKWLLFLINKNMVKNEKGEIVKISPLDLGFFLKKYLKQYIILLVNLDQIYEKFDIEIAKRVKEIENVTNHDVKAVEYYIKEQLEKIPVFSQLKEYVHFCCTSEDINNLAYSLMLTRAKDKYLLNSIDEVQLKLIELSQKYAEKPMLSRTHGQVASPTTVGKEFANFTYRANRQIKQLNNFKFSAKLNGAVGNFNAHIFAYPEYDWVSLSQEFIESIGLEFNPYTTQIEPHDSLAEFYNTLSLLNTIYLGLSRDIWNYISISYFKQKSKKNEVGSSTMPHKVNPIDFENCEGNLGLANSIANHFCQKLPISRFQRDLSDSTVMRNHGIAFGYSVVGYKSLLKGLDKIEVNNQKMNEDLDQHWEVLAEPIQTVMRKYGLENPYEILKDLTRGKSIVQKKIQEIQLKIQNYQKIKNYYFRTQASQLYRKCSYNGSYIKIFMKFSFFYLLIFILNYIMIKQYKYLFFCNIKYLQYILQVYIYMYLLFFIILQQIYQQILIHYNIIKNNEIQYKYNIIICKYDLQ
ncbi:hypothetical protein IMG5_192770 [Ichthyophthirius multifiliis]|uniref:Adenylosuccinate lyase n=1 Tax=Ichthyophthirius multifiliis TaxID=5932 RepID=G0R4H1_ICHMU|nr:hypothetical protein IMG5_192770 [Ichthyophthirius multifiliis]EGR27622.1 hypothetical protein IMG5_192770 [Ichthyophthirius multifiliis]|eukprot:XP_004025074.1 hypothetical protein IMG5_192770 [Ichthyophthirius multifiliis]